jgi:hypothetical protein
MNWTPYVIAWMCLGVATLGLAVYRKFLAMKEDDYIHIEEWKAGEVVKQETMAHKMRSIDRYGEALSVLTVLGGLVLGIAYLYAVISRS